MKISDILHCAADNHLAYDNNSYSRHKDKSRFSCCAVIHAAEYTGVDYKDIYKGLRKMGCPVDSMTALERFGYEDGWDVNKEAQGVRYMWLKLAALVAEEQGV